MMNHPNAAAVGGKMYVLGGLTPASDGAWRAVPDSWVYDPEKDSWEHLEPMPTGEERGSAAIGVHSSTIFLAGGMRTLMPGVGGEHDTLDVVSAYDSALRSWLSLPPLAQHLPARRDHAGSAVVGSTLYVLGGRDRGQVNVRDTVFALDLTQPSSGWSLSRGRMPTPRGGIAAAAVGPLVYTFGGEGNPAAGSGGVFNETEVYDTRTEMWQRLGPMKVPRHGTSAVGIGREVYIPGGGVTLGASGLRTFDKFHP
ncbi:kelch domain-containing 8a [Trichoderma arundinaceum]|uniref:Kelch domain-containing 8a n=1 Tax=Trichoderma arundinaceum TaxID=490622 RepID=A0A395ND60_TRIAR|nr:kelch domain-containing 8a [Trichoderma arundinaceum]